MSDLLLSEFQDEVLIRSGQFLVGDISAVGLDVQKFWILVRSELRKFQKYRPVTKKFNIVVNGKSFTFGGTPEEPLAIPDWISKILPVNSFTKINFYLTMDEAYSNEPVLRTPRQFLFEYEKPKLYISEPGKMDVTAHFKYPTCETFDETTGCLTEVTIGEFEDDDDLLIDMVVGRFLVALGRSKRSFTLSDLPIQSDSSELVSEGHELYTQTIDRLYDQSFWYHAVGV